MTRAAIYARFSTELQQERSIDDQVALCRTYASRNGLEVVAVFDDRARSGASMFGRDGLMRMLDAARDRAFDVILVEGFDRLSRDQEDPAGIWKRLDFLGIELCAVHDGKADQIQIGIRGLVGWVFLRDLANKVRRGLAGVVRDGRHAGGRAYGYRPVPGKPGELEVNEDEAAIVREIFASYIDGKTPRAIAAELNARRVPPPRGRGLIRIRSGNTRTPSTCASSIKPRMKRPSPSSMLGVGRRRTRSAAPATSFPACLSAAAAAAGCRCKTSGRVSFAFSARG